MGYDKTRLIDLLDKLERDRLLERTPDPADRRARIVRLTSAGEARHAAAQQAIREMESVELAALGGSERRALLSALKLLASR